MASAAAAAAAGAGPMPLPVTRPEDMRKNMIYALRLVPPASGPNPAMNNITIRGYIVRTNDGSPVMVKFVEQPRQSQLNAKLTDELEYTELMRRFASRGGPLEVASFDQLVGQDSAIPIPDWLWRLQNDGVPLSPAGKDGSVFGGEELQMQLYSNKPREAPKSPSYATRDRSVAERVAEKASQAIKDAKWARYYSLKKPSDPTLAGEAARLSVISTAMSGKAAEMRAAAIPADEEMLDRMSAAYVAAAGPAPPRPPPPPSRPPPAGGRRRTRRTRYRAVRSRTSRTSRRRQRR